MEQGHRGPELYAAAVHVHRDFDEQDQTAEQQATQALLALYIETPGSGASAPRGGRRGAEGKVKAIVSCE